MRRTIVAAAIETLNFQFHCGVVRWLTPCNRRRPECSRRSSQAHDAGHRRHRSGLYSYLALAYSPLEDTLLNATSHFRKPMLAQPETAPCLTRFGAATRTFPMPLGRAVALRHVAEELYPSRRRPIYPRGRLWHLTSGAVANHTASLNLGARFGFLCISGNIRNGCAVRGGPKPTNSRMGNTGSGNSKEDAV